VVARPKWPAINQTAGYARVFGASCKSLCQQVVLAVLLPIIEINQLVR
jgi:hypothetical protein